jgi:hypothetical protein
MLVDNKFLFISLPRCASTSFHISCLRSGFKIEHYGQSFVDNYHTPIDLTLTNEELADNMAHLHEKLDSLLSKFGDGYDIITIKRNRHERFVSLWKHIIDMVKMEQRKYPIELVNILEKLNMEDIIFFKDLDLISPISQILVIRKFAKTNGIEKYLDDYLENMLLMLFRPISFWHNNNPKIKWFEFGNFRELEEWVSNKTGKSFKMEKSNGSQHFDCNLKMNNDFIERYNSIYDYYDIQKNNNTLI